MFLGRWHFMFESALCAAVALFLEFLFRDTVGLGIPIGDGAGWRRVGVIGFERIGRA